MKTKSKVRFFFQIIYIHFSVVRDSKILPISIRFMYAYALFDRSLNLFYLWILGIIIYLLFPFQLISYLYMQIYNVWIWRVLKPKSKLSYWVIMQIEQLRQKHHMVYEISQFKIEPNCQLEGCFYARYNRFNIAI